MTIAATAGQTLVLVSIGAVAGWNIYAEIQELFIRHRTRDSLRTLLESSNEDWWVDHRVWLSKERTPRQLKLDRQALIDAVEEDYQAFALDWHDNATEVDGPKAA